MIFEGQEMETCGAYFSITWHPLSVTESSIKLGPAEMEKKGTMSIKMPVPVLESPAAAPVLISAVS